MRVKKFLVLASLCAFFAHALWASNGQQVFDLSSPVYRDVETLYILQGKSLPSGAKPWTREEVEFLLSRLDPSSFGPEEDALVREIESQYRPEKILHYDAYLQPQFYLHANDDDFDSSNDWWITYEKRPAPIQMDIDFAVGSHFYFYAEFPEFRLAKNVLDDDGEWQQGWLGANIFDTNFSFWESDVRADANFPIRAFMAAGGKNWSFQIGRDRLDWGNAESGNMLIDSHLQYHNMARLSAWEGFFTYTFVTSFFPPPDEIETAESNSWDEDSPLSGGVKMFMGHRFEFRLLHDKIGISLAEGVMYQPENGNVDLRELNPFAFYHNYYINSDANSIVQADVDWAFLPGWNWYAQVVIDEIRAIWSEPVNNHVHPDAVGFLTGFKNVRKMKKGIFRLAGEFAYTTPYLYLRTAESGSDEQDGLYDTNSFIVNIRRWVSGDVNYDYQSMGYPYGGDAIVFNFTGEYSIPGKWSLGGRFFAMIHGEKWKEGDELSSDNWSSILWMKGEDAYNTTTPSGGWDNAERWIILGVYGDKKWSPRWTTSGEADLLHVSNKDHDEDNDVWDFQVTFGATFRVF